MEEAWIVAIDQGTTGSTVVLATPTGEVLARASREFPQYFPESGWVEQEPEEIWESVVSALTEALDAVPGSREKIVALGITNQRETLLAWEKTTGQPVHRAIVWQDRRTARACEALRHQGHEDRVKQITGLVLDPYFSASKLQWLLQQDPALQRQAESGRLQAGSIDSFLVRRLTGQEEAVQEITNASRTQLLDLARGEWSQEMCDLWEIPRACLPQLVSSAEIVGRTRGVPGLPDGIPVAGIAGDQHAALFGQMCFEPGQAKCTYGTGAFVLVNWGQRPVLSSSSLLTTIAWKIGGQVTYALEGSAFVAGAAVQWLRDGLGIIQNSSEIEELAASVPSSAGVTFVPALVGLGAPYWDPEARGLITGLTRGTTKAHLARATLEALAFQVEDLLDIMRADLAQELKQELQVLRVDGGAAQNELLLQMQADFSGLTVERSFDLESTARGAVLLAALGVGLFRNVAELAQVMEVEKRWQPVLSEEERALRKQTWHQAVARARSSLGA